MSGRYIINRFFLPFYLNINFPELQLFFLNFQWRYIINEFFPHFLIAKIFRIRINFVFRCEKIDLYKNRVLNPIF